MMIAVHRRVVALLRWIFLRGMVIAVNGALVARAASAGGNGPCGERRRLNEQHGHKADGSGESAVLESWFVHNMIPSDCIRP